MTDASIKQKALTAANALLGTDRITLGQLSHQELMLTLVHVVEQSEEFKQEVGFALSNEWHNLHDGAKRNLDRFRIPLPKPDPLVEVLEAIDVSQDLVSPQEYANALRAALDARGFEIREKGQ